MRNRLVAVLLLIASPSFAGAGGLGAMVSHRSYDSLANSNVNTLIASGDAPTTAYKVALSKFLSQLRSTGVLSKLAVAYPLASPTQAESQVNLIAPDKLGLTISGSPTFTANQGWTGDCAAAYLTTATTLANLPGVVNNYSQGVWSLTDTADNGRDIGTTSGSNTYTIGRTAGNGFQTRSNSAAADTLGSIGNSLGFYGWSRADGSTSTQVKNGVVLASPARASSTFSNGNISVLRDGTSYSCRQLAFAFMGQALTAADWQNLFTHEQNILVSFGTILPNPLYYFANLEGTVRQYEKRTDIPSDTILRVVTGPWKFYGFNGNSTSVGSEGSAGPTVINVTPPAASLYTGMMFNQTTKPCGATCTNQDGTRGQGTSALQAATLTDLWPADERAYVGTQLGETHITGLLSWLSWRHDALSDTSNIYWGRSHGAAGQLLANVMLGTQPYANGLLEIGKAVSIAAVYGQTVTVPSIEIMNGHQDRTQGTARATFTSEMNTLQASYETDWKPVTGQSADIKVFVSQLDAGSQNTATTGSPISLAQTDFARTNALGRMSHSRYMLPHDNGDYDHFSALGYIREGEYEGKAYLWEEGYAASVNAYPWAPLGLWITATRSTNTISIQFFHDQAKTVPWGGLQWNTTSGLLESLSPTYGFTFDDDAHDAVVSSAAITTTSTANDTVVLTLSATPSGANKFWTYAYNGPGSTIHSAAWGNLSDSDTTPSRYFTGQNLVNWSIILNETIQ